MAIDCNGLIKGDRLIGVLRELISDCAIEDIATPLVFTPDQQGAGTLFDGALVNPLPVAATLNDATDLTIAVSLSGSHMPRAASAANNALLHGSAYRRRIGGFVERLPLVRKPKARIALVRERAALALAAAPAAPRCGR